MMSIRDELSQVIDIRIPPNGYRRYIKEVARTGGFQDMQRDDSLIALALCVEELQKEVVELRQQNKEPITRSPDWQHGPPEPSRETYICGKCGQTFETKIALMGHSRKKDHQDATTTQPAGSNSDQSL